MPYLSASPSAPGVKVDGNGNMELRTNGELRMVILAAGGFVSLGENAGVFLKYAGDGQLIFFGQEGALTLPSLTTVQRDALFPIQGLLIYNSTTDQVQVTLNSTWRTITAT